MNLTKPIARLFLCSFLCTARSLCADTTQAQMDLSSTDQNVRIQAIISMGKSQDPTVLPSLTALLNENDPRIQQEAIRALQTLNLPDYFVVDALGRLGHASDSPPQVRFDALVAALTLIPNNQDYVYEMLRFAHVLRTRETFAELTKVMRREGDNALPTVLQSFSNNVIPCDVVMASLRAIGTEKVYKENESVFERCGGKSPISHYGVAPGVTTPGWILHRKQKEQESEPVQINLTCPNCKVSE